MQSGNSDNVSRRSQAAGLPSYGDVVDGKQR